MYPEARMIDAMKIWKLPPEKSGMLSQICSEGEYFLTEKIDGCWYEFEKTDNYEYLFGRTTSKVTGLLTEKSDNVPHIKEALKCLPAGTILIGEIYVPGGTAKDVVHIMGCLPQEAVKRQEKEGLIKYYLHDIIMYDGVDLINAGAEDRYSILSAIWEKHNLSQYPFLRLAKKVDTEIEAEISHILKTGGEGAVLKKRNCPYVPGKRPAWMTLKIKQMDSIDLVITRTIAPTREYTGKDIETWPYWEKESGDNDNLVLASDVCQYGNDGWQAVTKPYFFGWHTSIGIGAYNDEGKLIELGTVASGLTDEMRQEMAEAPENYVGRVCSIDCMSIDRKEKTLRHPVFKCMRADKNPNECLINEIF